MDNEQVVRALWDAFDRAEFDDVRPLLADDFICEWTQSKELIRGRDNFIAVNQNYPGRWHIEIIKLIVSDNDVVTECRVFDDTDSVTALSFFTLKNGKIKHLREFWVDPMEAQAWRRQWVEIINEDKHGTN